MKKWLTYYSVLPSIADYKTPKRNNPLNKKGWFYYSLRDWPDEKRNQLDLKEEEISVYEVWLKKWSVEVVREYEKEEDNVYIVAVRDLDFYEEFHHSKMSAQELDLKLKEMDKEEIDDLVEREMLFKGTKQELFEKLWSEGILDDFIIVDEWEVYNGKEVTELKIFEEEEETYRKFHSEDWYLTKAEALEAVEAEIAYAKKEY